MSRILTELLHLKCRITELLLMVGR